MTSPSSDPFPSHPSDHSASPSSDNEDDNVSLDGLSPTEADFARPQTSEGPSDIYVDDDQEGPPWSFGEDEDYPYEDSDGDEGQLDEQPEPREKKGTVEIKEEPGLIDSNLFFNGSVIEISDDEGETLKVRREPGAIDTRFFADGRVIEVPDDDDPLIKEEEVQFLWANMDERCIDLDAEVPAHQVGQSSLTQMRRRVKTPADSETMARLQRCLAERALGKPLPSNIGRPNSLPTNAGRGRPPPMDDDSWMEAEYNLDEGAAARFSQLKKDYKSKVRAGDNTELDDLDFTKAERLEAARLKRLRLEFELNAGVHEADSDSDLFVSSSPPLPTSKRRPASAVNGDDVNAGEGNKRKRTDKKARVVDMEKELEMNMLAGIESFLRKQKPRKKSASHDAGKGQPGASEQKLHGRRRKARNKPGYLNDISSLLTSNVFVDAANNQAADPKVRHMEKDKGKFLSALVDGLPNNDSRRTEKNHIKRCTAILGRGKVVPADNGEDWKVKGMKSALHHHQIQGAAWMKERENGLEEPYGGLNCDSMGLGKTVETIALMVCNPPGHQDKSKSTLIVVQPGLLKQWYNELEKHAENETFNRIVRHHPGHRYEDKGAVEELQRASVVLTTYQEVVRSYPKAQPPSDLSVGEAREWWSQIWAQDCDILHKAHFYRIVLDESQAIKNHLSHTSIACRALMGKHRWTLSGTPIMNRLEELYPYFKFLRVAGTGTYSDFQDMYCIEGSDDCKKRLVCLLNNIMVRRTMKDKVLGRPIAELPPFTLEVERLDFNAVERTVYNIIMRRCIRYFNKASAEGDLEKKTGYGINMFIRLRQMTAHIFLIQEILQDIFDLDSIARLEQASIHPEDSNEHERAMIEALRRLIAAKDEPVEANPEVEEPEAPPGGLVKKLGTKLRKLKRQGKFDDMKREISCQRCKSAAVVPWVTSCIHLYCKDCLVFLAQEACQRNQNRTPCLACGTYFGRSEACGGLKELELQTDSLPNQEPSFVGKRDSNRKVVMKWVEYDDKLVLSTKLLGVKSQIMKWLAEAPDEKIVVFSQFHMNMRILEQVCERQGWEYCNYHGKMSQEARTKTIDVFGNENTKIRIMIASLSCGGIGLNLTMASRVICVDLWYNICAEEQAFCRVYRLGQKSKTFVTRFFINGTVDERLERMQEHKQKLIGGAIDDRALLSKLSAPEIMKLFGDVQIDRKTKRPYIVMDEDERLDAILPPLSNDDVDVVMDRMGKD